MMLARVHLLGFTFTRRCSRFSSFLDIGQENKTQFASSKEKPGSSDFATDIGFDDDDHSYSSKQSGITDRGRRGSYDSSRFNRRQDSGSYRGGQFDRQRKPRFTEVWRDRRVEDVGDDDYQSAAGRDQSYRGGAGGGDDHRSRDRSSSEMIDQWDEQVSDGEDDFGEQRRRRSSPRRQNFDSREYSQRGGGSRRGGRGDWSPRGGGRDATSDWSPRGGGRDATSDWSPRGGGRDATDSWRGERSSRQPGGRERQDQRDNWQQQRAPQRHDSDSGYSGGDGDVQSEDEDDQAPPPRYQGKRERKKLKAGFQLTDTGPVEPNGGDLLSGLHPVRLAVEAGRRDILCVFHKRPLSGRVQTVVEMCVARGVKTAPMTSVELDAIAQGTGVHQGICARVGPLFRGDFQSLLEALDEETSSVPAADEQADWSDGGSAVSSLSEAEHPDQSSEDAETASSLSPDESFSAAERHGDTVPAASDSDVGTGAVIAASEVTQPRIWLLLDRVQDPMNLGSIVRTSYFMGVERILLTDTNSCRLSATVSKASAGVLEVFPIHSVPEVGYNQLFDRLQLLGWQLLAANASSKAPQEEGEPPLSHQLVQPGRNTLLVVGNEGGGIDPALMARCKHVTVEPGRQLADGVESLNVSVAAGILLSRLYATS